MQIDSRTGRGRVRVALRRLARLALALSALAVGLMLYMLVEFQSIGVTRLALDAQTPALDGLRIVFAADFQYDMRPGDPQSTQGKTFQKAVDLINQQGADLVLLGGDYSTFADGVQAAVPYLRQLHAPLGVYGVLGNHDGQTADTLAALLPNIHFLANETVRIPYGGVEVAVCGVEDLWRGAPAVDLQALAGAAYRILLTHNPDFHEDMAPEARDAFDLTLAGHTHAGQVTLLGFRGFAQVVGRVTRYGERYRYGETAPYGRRVYTTSGLGGSVYGLPIRFGARPEVVVIQ